MPMEQKLSDVLSEFARTMATEFPIQAILDHLVELIVDMLPISGAGVTIIAPGLKPRYVAASDESALRYERLQTELGEGPCLLAYQSGGSVSVPDLRDENRFPEFTPRALDAGLVAVFTFPLHHGERQLGALDLYRGTSGDLSTEAMSAAQTLADVAAAYLISAQTRQDLQQASLHDGLTGLPNRGLLLDRLAHAFRRSRRSGHSAAVLFIDLDRLKAVNDSYGHGVGDQLLVAVAKRLTGLVRPSDTLARLSGDEFVVVCEDLDNPTQATAIGNRLVLALARPYVLSGVEVAMTASIGLAYAERGDHTPEQLLHEADTAMYQAKRRGGDRQQVFDSRLQHLAVPLAGLEHDLLGAVRREELRNEYQPIVATATARIVGVESLLRWSHPSRGDVPPSTLIPLAEQSDLIIDIGAWALQQAWADRSRWLRSGGSADMTMSVNVSPVQIMSTSFAATVAAVIDDGGASPDLLTLEITESVFLHDGDRAVRALKELRDLGVRLALDDFGTGYSSLSYLKRFPVDVIKIDRSFIADLGTNRASDVVVEGMVRIAHDLGITVVAEGIETADQYAAVTRFGCDLSQGFYFARPMPSASVEDLLDQGIDHRIAHAGR